MRECQSMQRPGAALALTGKGHRMQVKEAATAVADASQSEDGNPQEPWPPWSTLFRVEPSWIDKPLDWDA